MLLSDSSVYYVETCPDLQRTANEFCDSVFETRSKRPSAGQLRVACKQKDFDSKSIGLLTRRLVSDQLA
jgi:hypothetical protein